MCPSQIRRCDALWPCRRPQRYVFVIVAFTALAIVGSWLLTPRRSLPGTVSEKEYRLAEEAFEVRYGREANRVDVMSWLAEWYLAHDRQHDAIQCFAEIDTSHPEYGHMARYQQGRTLLGLHQAPEAERQFRELIAAEAMTPRIETRYLVDARQPFTACPTSAVASPRCLISA